MPTLVLCTAKTQKFDITQQVGPQAPRPALRGDVIRVGIATRYQRFILHHFRPVGSLLGSDGSNPHFDGVWSISAQIISMRSSCFFGECWTDPLTLPKAPQIRVDHPLSLNCPIPKMQTAHEPTWSHRLPNE